MGMNMPSGGSDEPELMVEMNTTPLIDVMLVLLIMLIITIPVQTHAVKLNMPTGNPPTENKELPVIVQIDISASGVINWNGTNVVSRQDLEQKIQSAALLNPQPEVHLRPDKAANYEVVAMVMAATQRLGLNKMGLIGSEQFAD
jgi:biopolymer transport protein ExbD